VRAQTAPTFIHGKFFIQPAVPQPVNLLHFDLHRNTLFHRLNVADHADGFPGGVQRVERIQRGIQRFTVERAEPFIQEQGIDPRFMAHQIGKRQRQRQADQEALAARERAGIAYRIRLPGIDHFQLQRVAGLALQQITPVQTVKLLVSKPDEIIQRQPLSELTELVAGAGADQRVQITPVVRLARGLFNLLHQRQLVLTVIAVLLELLADLALMRGVLAKLLRQLLQLDLQSGCIGLETFRAQRNMRL
jgi:hypothetical protein